MSNTENIIAIIQARMNSSRLPAKIMSDISGKPMIWHIVERLKNIKSIGKIVIATTNDTSDKSLCDYATTQQIPYYAGSTDDIIDRIYQCGKKFNATAVLKVNGDCPLIDIDVLQQAINKYVDANPKPDLITNTTPNTFPEGLQFGIFKFSTIRKLWEDLKDPFWREFAFMYVIENKEKFDIINIENNVNLSRLRWTVDYQEDLDFVRHIYDDLYPTNKSFTMHAVLSLLDKKPHLKQINENCMSSIGSYEKLRDLHNKNTS